MKKSIKLSRIYTKIEGLQNEATNLLREMEAEESLNPFAGSKVSEPPSQTVDPFTF